MIYITYDLKNKKVVRADTFPVDATDEYGVIESEIDIMDDFLMQPLIINNSNEIVVDEQAKIQILINDKVKEMNEMQQKMISNGIDVTLSDGSVDHFDLSANDQVSLMGLQAVIASGQEFIPWHTSDNTQHCKLYSAKDMQMVITKSTNYVAYHITYFRDLRIYINSLTDVETIKNIEYGMDIPEEYQSEPLKLLIATINSSVANND